MPANDGKQRTSTILTIALVAMLLVGIALLEDRVMQVLALLALLPAVYAIIRGVIPAPTDADDGPERSVYRIGRCTIDEASREIRFQGVAAEVQPRVFDLILYLVRERGRAVSKDELFEKVWPNVIVSESSLTQSVKRARDLFRDHGMAAEVIRTVHSRGYRFDADVTQETSSAAVDAAEAPVLLVGSIVAGVAILATAAFLVSDLMRDERPAAPPNSLVVLPFEDLTGDASISYFPEGLTETVSNALMRVNGLRIIGRASANSWRPGGDESLEAFAAKLNVANAIRGTVQKSGDVLRVTVNLLRVDDNYVMWSQSYDRELENVFDVQDDIARSVVDRMEVLLSDELTGFEAATRVESGEAYQLLLRANQQQDRRTEVGLATAHELYRESLRLDPDYAPALLGLAQNIYQRATMGSIPRGPAYPESVALIRQALTLDPANTPALVMLAEIQHRYFWDFDDAQVSFERAFEINPNSANTLSAYSRYLSKIGEFDRAVDTARAAKELDPLSQSASGSLVLRLVRAGQVEEARQVLEEMREVRPDNGDLPWLESLLSLRLENYQDALRLIAEDDFEYIRLSISAIALYHLGCSAEAEAALERLIETDADGAGFQIAEVYAQWGRADEAFEWLERAYSQGDPGMAELLSSPNLEPVYDDPRFDPLLAKVGLPTLH